MYTYPLRLVNSRCVLAITLKVKPIYSLYYPNSPSQLALCVRNKFKVEAIVRVVNQVHLPGSQLAWFVRDNFRVEPIDLVYLPNSLSQLTLLHETTRKNETIFGYTS